MPCGRPHFTASIPTMRLYAIRGANAVAANESSAIRQATVELLDELMNRNGLKPADFVSCIFTVTPDLDADFPAAAAREVGFAQVPLLCACEIPVPGSMPRVVRILAHYHSGEDHSPEHVYLGDAQRLRPDLGSAQ